MTTHLPIPKATGTMPPWRATLLTLSLSLAGLGTTAHAQTQSNADEDAALGLEIATPAAEAPQGPRAWSLTSEVGAIATQGRDGWANEGATRASVALRGNYQPTEATSVRYSARLDAFDTHVNSFAADHDRTASLLELYVTHAINRDLSVQAGRINVREGNAYSFNPTDYYRANSVKLFVNPSPLVTRESRQGTFGLRGLWLQPQGALSVLYSPKLGNPGPSNAWGLDSALTNPSHSLLVTWSRTLSEKTNVKLLGLKASDQQWQLGLSGSTLVGDALTLHAEGSHGRAAGVAFTPSGRVANQWALGGTLTTGQWSWTLEQAYNGQAITDAAFTQWVVSQPQAAYAYLSGAERLQSQNARRNWLFYVSRPDFIWSRVELRGFVRLNPNDHGRMTWLELRRKFDRFDLGYQFTATQGRATSMYGITPAKRLHQVVLTHHL